MGHGRPLQNRSHMPMNEGQQNFYTQKWTKELTDKGIVVPEGTTFEALKTLTMSHRPKTPPYKPKVKPPKLSVSVERNGPTLKAEDPQQAPITRAEFEMLMARMDKAEKTASAAPTDTMIRTAPSMEPFNSSALTDAMSAAVHGRLNAKGYLRMNYDYSTDRPLLKPERFWTRSPIYFIDHLEIGEFPQELPGGVEKFDFRNIYRVQVRADGAKNPEVVSVCEFVTTSSLVADMLRQDRRFRRDFYDNRADMSTNSTLTEYNRARIKHATQLKSIEKITSIYAEAQLEGIDYGPTTLAADLIEKIAEKRAAKEVQGIAQHIQEAQALDARRSLLAQP